MLKTIAFTVAAVLLSLASYLRVGSDIPLEGEKTLYLYSASSNCLILTGQTLRPYFKSALKGESVVLSDPSSVGGFLEGILAELVFEERVGSTVCEYYYSPQISVYKSINGQKVNIHIAKNPEKTVVGIPLIFGSY